MRGSVFGLVETADFDGLQFPEEGVGVSQSFAVQKLCGSFGEGEP